MGDGCSGGPSLFWRTLVGKGPAWEYCCDEHDLAYEQGGDSATRKWADGILRDCMLRAGYPLRAWIYYCAVRLFGAPHWNKEVK